MKKAGPTIDVTTITDPRLRNAVRDAVVGAADIRCDRCRAWVGEVFHNPAGGWLVVGVHRKHSPVLDLAVTMRRTGGTYALTIDGKAITGRVPDAEYGGIPALVASVDDRLPPIECNAHGPLDVRTTDVLGLPPLKNATIRARAQRSD